MISALCEGGYIERQKKSASVSNGSYVNTFEVYLLTQKGKTAMQTKQEVVLPVPQAVRQQEEEEKRNVELKKAGVILSKIPEKELQGGCGKTIDAHLAWI